MSTLSVRLEHERLRLWGGSGLGVLLAHVAVAALLLQHFHWQQPVLAGAGDFLNVDLESLPAATSGRAAPSPRQPAPPPRALQPRLLGQPLEPLATVEPAPAIEAAAAPAGLPAATPALMPLPQSSLTAVTATDASGSGTPSAKQAWLAQILSLLQRYKEYPRRAVRRHQQDTVSLQFAIDDYGRLLDVQADSPRHYRDLEEEAKTMVRLAAPLPPPPPELRAERIVVSVPVEFRLIRSTAAAAAAECVEPASPGEAPDGAAANLEQMEGYRQRLQDYVAAMRGYSACLQQHGAAPPPGGSTAPVDRLVERFDSQARLYQATATHRALLAQQAQQQALAAQLSRAEALAATSYAACAQPAGAERLLPAAGDSVRADQWLAYRQAVMAYDSVVRRYIACIARGLSGTLAAEGALSAAQHAQLTKQAADLQNAAVEPLNGVIHAFNTQLQALEAQQRRAGASSTPGALALAGTWSVPSPPLPVGECVRIAYRAATWRASLCQSTYSSFSDESEPERIIVVGGTRTYAYDVSDLQVTGRRVSLTINRTLQSDTGSDLAVVSQRFELTLSPDGQRLAGVCRIEDALRPCQFVRRP